MEPGIMTPLSVLAFNLWYGGTRVPDGVAHAAEVIREVGADVALLPERGEATAAIAEALGWTPTSRHAAVDSDTGVVSRFPILDGSPVGDRWTKVVIAVGGVEVVVYGGHLEHRWYGVNLPRGYGAGGPGTDGPAAWSGWARLDAPVTDVDAILAVDAASGRAQSARELLADMAAERARGRRIIVGGDFNEASARDWTAATADLADHHGAVVPWETVRILERGGLVDAWRAVHPDAAAHPGYTWPAGTPAADLGELTWSPDADERDRIDFVLFDPEPGLALTEVRVVGPRTSVVRGRRVVDDGARDILETTAVWPSDHRAVLARFDLTRAAGPAGAAV